MAIPRKQSRAGRAKQEAPVASAPKLALDVTVKKSFSSRLDEAALRELVVSSLPKSVRELRGLSVSFDGGDFCDVTCLIQWDSTETSTEELS